MPYIVDTEKEWYNVRLPLRQCTLKELASSQLSKEEIDDLYEEAKSILAEEGLGRQRNQRSWYSNQFLQRGTISDKIASAAVKLSEPDFMFSMDDAVGHLLDTARNDTHNYEAALKALVAVWPRLMPPRTLKRFSTQYFPTLPVGTDPTNLYNRKRVLVYWYVEDSLKKAYTRFLSLAEAAMKDKLAVRREAWLDTVGKLLNTVAEGRALIITMLVDKMGDPLSSVSHKSYHLLLQMLSESSTNQAVLQSELERVGLMKGCPAKTMGYCVNVMNQLVFNKDERKLALKCVNTYLTLFKQMVLTTDIDQTVTTAIIVGLRRAFPYAAADYTVLEHHLNSLFILGNTGNFTQRVSSLSLLQQLLKSGTLHQQGRQYKESLATLEDRWYRSLYHLLLMSPKQLPHSSQLSGFFSMVYKAVRADKDSRRVAAFVHRLIQRCLYHAEAYICASLLLVAEMIPVHSLVRSLLRSPANTLIDSSVTGKAKQQAAATSEGVDAPNKEDGDYDPVAREPRFAKAYKRSIWVLNLLARHSHPAVAKIAVLLLLGQEVVFDSHPLDDLTMSNFLQMFVDAKAAPTEDLTTVTGGSKGVAVFKRTVHVPAIPSASDAHFIEAVPESVDVTALFLHRYAVQRQRFLDSQTQKKFNPWDSKKNSGDNLLEDDDGDDDILAFDESDDEAERNAKKAAKKAKKDEQKRLKKEEAAAAAALETPEEIEARMKGAHNEALFGPEKTVIKKGKKVTAAEIDPSEDDEEVSDDGFDADFADDDSLDWGSDDEHAFEDLEDGDDDSLEDNDGEDSGDDGMLGGGGPEGADDTGDDFGALVDKNKKAPTKRARQQTKWEEKQMSNAREFEATRGGRRVEGGRGASSRGGRGGRR